MTDPRISQDLQSHLDGKGLYAERALRIRDLTKVKPFDPTVLCRENADFRGLTEFLRKHAPVALSQGVGGSTCQAKVTGFVPPGPAAFALKETIFGLRGGVRMSGKETFPSAVR